MKIKWTSTNSFTFLLACILMLCLQLCYASSQNMINWNLVHAKVAARKWQEGADLMDDIDTRDLHPSDADAYCYYMGICKCKINGRDPYGRQLLLKLLQYSMVRVEDVQTRNHIIRYVKEILSHSADSTDSEDYAVEKWSVTPNAVGHTGGVRSKLYYLGDVETKVKPLHALPDSITLSHDDLLRIVQLPQEQSILQLNAQMRLGSDSSVRGILTSNKHSLIFIGNKAIPSPISLQMELASFSEDIDTALAFFHKEFDATLPQAHIILFTVADRTQLQMVSRRLHGIEQGSFNIGYSVPDEFTAVAIGSSIGDKNTGTLYHELCHIVFQNDFLSIPVWLDEGLASLYSSFEFKEGTMHGIAAFKSGGAEGQWRGEVLRRVGKWHPNATELVRMTSDAFSDPQTPRSGFHPEFFENHLTPQIATQATNNATACYLLLYLQERGKLFKFYQTFRDRNFKTVKGNFGNADVELLKQIAGKNIDSDFNNWLTATIRQRTH